MKLENLLLSGNSIKISDFGCAIKLDATMKLPFAYGISELLYTNVSQHPF